MKTLSIALLAGLLATSATSLVASNAMADQRFTLGETFTIETGDACKVNAEKQVVCFDQNGDPQVTFIFNGIVAEGAQYTQERQRATANNPTLKAKEVEAMKDRVMDWFVKTDATLSAKWNGAIGDVLPYGVLYTSHGTVALAEGIVLYSVHIWYKGNNYELNMVVRDTEDDFKAVLVSLDSLKIN